MQQLDLGFVWDGGFSRNRQRGAYCLPRAAQGSFASPTQLSLHYTQQGEGDPTALREIAASRRPCGPASTRRRFLALSVRPSQMAQAAASLCAAFGLRRVSFDELLLRHLRRASPAA